MLAGVSFSYITDQAVSSDYIGFHFSGDNIQTAICVAKECGIISRNEVVANINATFSSNGIARPNLVYTLSDADSSKFVNIVFEHNLQMKRFEKLKILFGYSKKYPIPKIG